MKTTVKWFNINGKYFEWRIFNRILQGRIFLKTDVSTAIAFLVRLWRRPIIKTVIEWLYHMHYDKFNKRLLLWKCARSNCYYWITDLHFECKT